ncbi:MAG: cysteine desulfurase [Trueperaceae bacterium]|nr:cysteine desulfurase [Trueperaceae bacterium]
MPLDSLRLRQDFPILARQINGKPLIYFDNAASSQKPKQVVETMLHYYYHSHANVHRGAHTLSVEATDLYEAARGKLARFINAPEAESVIFTRNTTEAMNLIAYSWGMENLKAGDEIIIDYAEHHANIVPWHFVAAKTGAVIKAIKLGRDFRLDMTDFEALLSKRTRVVSVAHMSNVLGVIHPIKSLAQKAHDAGAIMIADGAQAAPHVKVDVQDLGVDFYTLSGHKMCGPTGAGALWGKAELLRGMPPFLGGGEMIRKVAIDTSSYADIPNRFEAGTPNIAEAIALGAAADYLESIGMDAIFEHDQELTRYALERLKTLEGLELYGPEGDDRGGIIPFNIKGVHPHDVATALDQEGIAIRAGHHCAQPLMKHLGVQSTARASFYFYNSFAEVDKFVEVVAKTRDFFAQFA